MNPSLVTLANAFHVGAIVLGAPSLAATLLYGVFRLRLWLWPAPPTASFSAKNPDAILLVLGGFARTVETVARVVGGISQAVFGVVAAVAAVGLVVAIALYLTGRGLHAHQGWARVAGAVLMSGLSVVSLVAVLSFRGPFVLVPLLFLTGGVSALWALWRGFVAP